MHANNIETSTLPLNYDRGGLFVSLARKRIHAKLEKLEFGFLKIIEAGQTHQFGDSKCSEISLKISDARFWTELALGGNTGGGKAYIDGYWQCDDLVGLIRLLVRNAKTLTDLDGSTLRIVKILDRLRHFANRNTEGGSAENIAAHYDLGNDFFELFLDPSLMYSSAFYPSKDTDLDQAAQAKLERICQKLNLKETDHVLEIGTGWGGFAIYAARNYGCHITTTTISKEQHNLAKARIKEAGLENNVTLLLKDYRALTGHFDKVVSIEMIEAVGHQFLDTYIAQCNRLLKDDGTLVLQAITMKDQHYQKALTQVDFIKKFIFPGGFLPSVNAISDALTRVSDLQIVHLEDIGYHYAKTLEDWRHRFIDKLDRVREQGYPESFIRMWTFYLCYCEGSFREAYIGTVQIVANKPRAKTPSFNMTIEQL